MQLYVKHHYLFSLMVMCVLVFKCMINHSFDFTTNNMDNLQVIICIIKAIIAIILQITRTNIILIVVVVTNVVVIYKLDSNGNNVCKFNKNRYILYTERIIAIIVIHSQSIKLIQLQIQLLHWL